MQANGRTMQSRRVLALTPDLVARCGEAVPQRPNDRFTPASDQDYERALDYHLALVSDAPFRVFAYGSLIWKPGFEVLERIPGTVLGGGGSSAFGWSADEAHRSGPATS